MHYCSAIIINNKNAPTGRGRIFMFQSLEEAKFFRGKPHRAAGGF
jgi:hypothetical protein